MVEKPKPKLNNSIPRSRPQTTVDQVPIAFRAQIAQRGDLQYVNRKEGSILYEVWTQEWLQVWKQQGGKIQPEAHLPTWVNDQNADFNPQTTSVPTPQVKTFQYQLQWRLVSNSGQDMMIRPVWGAKGLPYFPGSSMKGAFRQACTPTQVAKYFGQVDAETGVEGPGILRFHGGYPLCNDWATLENLVDTIHPQEDFQVKDGRAKHSAKVMISIAQAKFCFGISSRKELSQADWQEVRSIWEKALRSGLGSRVSAGYGYFVGDDCGTPAERVLPPVHLYGIGIQSKRLTQGTEFRPNLFKATLRGHALRLFGGMTDERRAIEAASLLWGGTSEASTDENAIWGQLGIRFAIESLNTNLVGYHSDRFEIEGQLELIRQNFHSLSDEQVRSTEKFAEALLQFTLLLGGFGKSWRRVAHCDFYDPVYEVTRRKAPIGCQWSSASLYLEDGLEAVKDFLKTLPDITNAWLQIYGKSHQSYAKHWREAWHPDKVQVWGRLVQEGKSEAIDWFHDGHTVPGKYIKSIPGNKKENRAPVYKLAGAMGRVGRIWHRMYPQSDETYIELLTVFPELHSQKEIGQHTYTKDSEQLIRYLAQSSSFQKLWDN